MLHTYIHKTDRDKACIKRHRKDVVGGKKNPFGYQPGLPSVRHVTRAGRGILSLFILHKMIGRNLVNSW